MSVYKVPFSYTVYGTAVHIEAESAEEAEKWLFDELYQNGLEEFEYKCNDRDYHTEGAQDADIDQ